jgi:hypothetical protein
MVAGMTVWIGRLVATIERTIKGIARAGRRRSTAIGCRRCQSRRAEWSDCLCPWGGAAKFSRQLFYFAKLVFLFFNHDAVFTPRFFSKNHELPNQIFNPPLRGHFIGLSPHVFSTQRSFGISVHCATHSARACAERLLDGYPHAKLFRLFLVGISRYKAAGPQNRELFDG